jgi:hypothetical protein
MGQVGCGALRTAGPAQSPGLPRRVRIAGADCHPARRPQQGMAQFNGVAQRAGVKAAFVDEGLPQPLALLDRPCRTRQSAPPGDVWAASSRESADRQPSCAPSRTQKHCHFVELCI